MNWQRAYYRFRYRLNTLLFLAPWLIVFLTFSLYPILYSLFLSFNRYRASGVRPPQWVGVGNYAQLLNDSVFLQSLFNSAKFVLGTVPPTICLALLLAILLNGKLRFKGFYRAAYFMPVVTTLFVTATLFIQLYAPQGPLNAVLRSIGLNGKHWLKDPDWALSAIMWMNIWASFGFYTLMLLAGLQNIPRQYYECSALEGASKLRQFQTITLPLLRPTLFVALLINAIFAFQIFGEIYIMTKGGPLHETETVVYYLYNQAFHKQKMGYASAAAYWVFLCLLLFSFAQFWLMRSKRQLTV